MPFPTIHTLRTGGCAQVVSQLANVPCLTLDPTAKCSRTTPPMFWQPPSEAVIYGSAYTLGPFTNVFCHVATGAFLDPLQVTGTGFFRAVDCDRNVQSTVPEIVMIFETDGESPGCRYTTEDAVEMEYWQAGALVSLLLDFGDGDDFTTQTLFLQRSLEMQTVALHHMAPLLMEYPHLLHWQRRNSNSGEYSSARPGIAFDDMRRVANHPRAVSSEPFPSLGSPLFTESLDDSPDILF